MDHQQMAGRRYVFLDLGERDLCVVLPAVTGVVYQHQYGGTACKRGQVEGYLVPVHAAPMGGGGQALAALREIFEDEMGGAGWIGGVLPGDLMPRLRGAVGKIPFCASGRTAGDLLSREEKPLLVDESRLGELDEAWVPVIAADGPAVLVWHNSD
jgi:hypothetical protein